jgi:ABC-type oligopeptide transport system substrate-binding subunit
MKRGAIFLLAGVAMLAGGRLAGASPAAHGGVLRLGMTGASVGIDPQKAYITTAWWLEYATAAKLFNYPDRRGPAGSLLRPEVASSFQVSGDGKTYTFPSWLPLGNVYSVGDVAIGVGVLMTIVVAMRPRLYLWAPRHASS